MRPPFAALGYLTALCLEASAVPSGVIPIDIAGSDPAPGATAVWNRATGSIHVPIFVDRSGGTVPGQQDELVDIGSGNDGPFNAGTAATFDIDGGIDPTLVTLDTSVVYEFTDFSLPPGVTLRGAGTEPLRIKVQGNAVIRGTIDLRGEDGGPSDPAAGAANEGQTCCGAGAGGQGMSSATALLDATGESPAAGVDGGQPGDLSIAGGTSGAGGGGGGNKFAGTAGMDSGPFAGGAAGPVYGDQTLETLIGGAGGGGGGGNSAGPNTTGGGGGGGGGALSFEIGGSFLNEGDILTTGGAGCDADPAHEAGAGGGGAGGSVLIYAGGTGTNLGLINSEGGSGGAGAAPGGAGADGIHRFALSTGDFANTGGLGEPPRPSIAPAPKSVYSQNLHTLQSAILDTGVPNPHYQRIAGKTESRSGDLVEIEVAGSHDAFVGDDTGWVAQSRLSELEGRRYIRFRVRLQSASADSTPRLSELAVHYQALFEYSVMGCAHSGFAKASSLPSWPRLFALFSWALLTFAAGRWLARQNIARS